MIVVDTNVLAYATLPGERTEAALQVVARDSDWVAPPLWRSEFRNLLATAMRAHGMTLRVALDAFGAAEGLVRDALTEGFTGDCLRLAADAEISAYDAEFVALAQRYELRLVTADRRLARAFPEQVVSLEDFAAGH